MVSIVIPVYNAEKDLKRCTDSIIFQSFWDFELILVDDGSSDNSASICDDYAKKDERVKVYHKENGGVSSARNLGIEKATGEYITFLDVDDYFEKDYLEKMMEYKDYDLIVSGFKRFGEIEDENKPEKTIIVNIREELQTMWNKPIKGFIFWYCWGKIYRTEIIKENKLEFFSEMKYSEDNCFLLHYMSKIDTFAYVSESGYEHYYEGKRARKYRMGIKTFMTHVKLQEKAFRALEKKNGHYYRVVRRDVYKRFLKCFLSNFLR